MRYFIEIAASQFQLFVRGFFALLASLATVQLILTSNSDVNHSDLELLLVALRENSEQIAANGDFILEVQRKLDTINENNLAIGYGNVEAIERLNQSQIDTAFLFSLEFERFNQTFVTYTQLLLGIVREIEVNVTKIYDKQIFIKDDIGKIEGNIVTIKDVQKEIKDFLIAPEEFGKFVLKTLNEVVTTFSTDEMNIIEVALDFCEYDPLGLGPINCDVSEMFRVRQTGLKFE